MCQKTISLADHHSLKVRNNWDANSWKLFEQRLPADTVFLFENDLDNKRKRFDSRILRKYSQCAQCNSCERHKQMKDFPCKQMSHHPPFHNTGVDYRSTIAMQFKQTKNFVSSATKAVQIEIKQPLNRILPCSGCFAAVVH